MDYLTLVVLFIVGAIFGSFGSVVLTRFSENISWDGCKQFLFGRSKCPNCHNVLKAKNLIPFFSYIFQNGKCEYCKKKISIMYPLLELFSGLIFVLTYLIGLSFGHLGYGEIVFWIVINRGFMLLIFRDFMYYELHFFVWISLLVISLFVQFFGIIGSYQWAFFGSLIFGGLFYVIYLVSNRYTKLKYHKIEGGFGMGDVFFAFLIGILVPFIFVYNGLLSNFSEIFIFVFLFIMASSLIGLGYGLISFILNKSDKKKFMKFRIAFVPSMILAFWLLLLFGKTFYTLLFF